MGDDAQHRFPPDTTEVGGVSPLSLLWGSLLGLGLWSLVLGLLPKRRARLAERLAPYLLDVSPGARALHRPLLDDPIVVFGRLLSPGVRRIVETLDRLSGGGEHMERGEGSDSPGGSLGQNRLNRVAVGLSTAAGGAFAVAVVHATTGALSTLAVTGVAVIGFFAGVGAVDYRRRRVLKARQERIKEEFPTVLEMLGLALAAGDSLPRAIARVSERSTGELGKDWALIMRGVELGGSLAEGLRASARRLGSAPVGAFIEHLVQSLERGAPLREVVASHAEDAKDSYSRGLVDRAGKAEVQMLVPMVLLILPVTVIFAVWPGLQALEFAI